MAPRLIRQAFLPNGADMEDQFEDTRVVGYNALIPPMLLQQEIPQVGRKICHT